MKRDPVRGQTVKWCVCGEWFASEREEQEHKCPGPREAEPEPVTADNSSVP